LFEKNFCQELFLSLQRRGSFRLSHGGFLIALEKSPDTLCLTLSTLLFQKDFLPLALQTIAVEMQKKSGLSPYLSIDHDEMQIFLLQKIPLFLPEQLECLVSKFLFSAKRWCSLIQELG
jgi:hypothetical protein